ncbi:uncharacterized protein N7443_009145 [Penicillium atrosanguineum]|uniref:uncharacterized protein n=1 Tax=Penicillium atrosanguineum TaxID=1132637 RepID=UPI0023A06166|nr:uncharacterized protein N7443_009145 [Penicillium atrosanguineum]KAJ5293192.1 hypothetical protein N7443_009145 [Penicillium atrosanguineum]
MRAPSGRVLSGLMRQTLNRSGLKALTRNYSTHNLNLCSDAQSDEPTAAEILRFALTSSKNPDAGNERHTSLRKPITELLDSEWQSSSPPPALWNALKGVDVLFKSTERRRLQSVADLASLRNVIHKLVVDDGGADRLQQRECKVLGNALKRCQRDETYIEILATLSDIIARLQRLELPISSQIVELGMYHAALNLLPSAFRRFLQLYEKLGGSKDSSPLSKKTSPRRILQTLLHEVDSALFEDPSYNTAALLAEITGEGEHEREKRPRLADCLLRDPHQEHENWALYLCLLSKLQSVEALDTTWTKFMNAFDPNNQKFCHQAYSVILSLTQARRSDTAAKFLEDISMRSEDTLPYIGDLQSIHVLLDDPIVGEALPDLVQGDHYEKLLEVRMEDMEERLGIQWQDNQAIRAHKSHVSTAPDSAWSSFLDQPLLTIDGDSAGYDEPARLYPNLQAYGCSRQRSDLRQLIDMLIDQTGNEQEITTHLNFDPDLLASFHSEFPTLQLRWCVEHSPIEFSDYLLAATTKESKKWSPASLGLIRARAIVNGVPQKGTRALHLVQLGSLDLRYGPDERWQPSGYIVAWDRQYGEMVALFVGKNYGVVDRGAAPSDAPFGAVMHIRPSDMPNALPLSPNRIPRVSDGPYYLDVDPSVN